MNSIIQASRMINSHSVAVAAGREGSKAKQSYGKGTVGWWRSSRSVPAFKLTPPPGTSSTRHKRVSALSQMQLS
jgi:hypothetical protein